MKKLLSLILVCTLVISFGATVFADTYIRYTFYDNTDGYTYHFGAFDSDDTDAGVIINGKEYTLKNEDANNKEKTAFEVAMENGNIFGIGFKTADSFTDDSYVVTPYSKDAEGNLKKGQAVTVSANPSTSPAVNEKAYAVTDDLYNNFAELKTDTTSLLVRTDGLNGPINRQNQQTTVLKLDLTKFKDAIAESNFVLNLYGNVSTYNQNVSEGFDSIKVQVCSTSQEWSESDLSSFTTASLLTQISNKNFIIDTVTIDMGGEKDWYKLNITSLIQQELAKDSESVSIALWCDNTEAEALSKVDNMRNALQFVFSSKDGTNPPYIEYQKVDPSYTSAELETLSINGTEVDISEFDNENSITKKLSYGVTVDSIVATASGNYATVSDAVKVDDDTYTVTVTAGNGTEKTYTINFEWATYPSVDAGTNGSFAKPGLVTGAWYGSYATAENTIISGAYSNSNQITIWGTLNDATLNWSGGTVYKPNVAIVKFDLSKLTDLDDTKDTNLYTYGTTKHHDNGTSIRVSLYDVTDEDLTEITIEDLRNISRWTEGKDLISTADFTNLGSSKDNSININKLIDKYYGTDIQPAIAIYITPVDRGDENKYQRAQLNLDASNWQRTAIKYSKFSK